MTAYGFFRMFFRMLWLCIFLGGMLVLGLASSVVIIYAEVSTEIRFREHYGSGWQSYYKGPFGSLARGRAFAVFGGLGMAGLSVSSVWLYRGLFAKPRTGTPSRRRRRNRHRQGSRVELIVRYRVRGLLRICVGVIGIAGGVFLVVFRVGIFAAHADEAVLGIFVFLAGYCGVIAGCSSLLKAKAWDNAVLFIGFMPLAVFLIPFVRLLVWRVPGVLAASMVMAPLILVVVVLVLPDKSGVSRRRGGWARNWHPKTTLETGPVEVSDPRPESNGLNKAAIQNKSQ